MVHVDEVDAFFTSLVAEIETAYERLGHRLGWRFLYSPARTLAPGTQLAFVGANPGGSTWEAPSPSVEEGNAYRWPVETWPGGGPGGPNPLQRQVGLLYDELARALPGSSPAGLMDDTLAANFCPFRSPSLTSLPNREQSLAFSRELWQRIIARVTPSAVICLGDLPARELATALRSAGYRAHGGPERGGVGWGSATYELASYESPETRTVLARLPHLSRYAIFGRPESRPAIERVSSVVAAAIAGTTPPPRALAAPVPKPAPKDRRVVRTPAQGAWIVAVRDENGRYPQPEALVPRVPPEEVQRYYRARGEALVLSCSRRKHLGWATTWIVLTPDGTHTVDGPDQFGFPQHGLPTFEQALPYARYGARRGGAPGPHVGSGE